MEIQTPELITNAFAWDGDKNTILQENPDTQSPLASFKSGFPKKTSDPKTAGGIPPQREDINGVLNIITQHIKYLNGGGVYKFNQSYCDVINGYWKGAVLQADDGSKSYVSLIDNNTLNFNEATEEELEGIWAPYGGNGEGGGDSMPVGTVIFYAGSTAPEGFLVINGAQISKATYPELSEILGTKFNLPTDTDDTKVRLPNLIDKYAKGGLSVGLPIQAKAPNIKGNITDFILRGGLGEGAFNTVMSKNASGGGSMTGSIALSFDASRSSTIYSDTATTIDVDGVMFLPCIKAFNGSVNEALIDITELANDVNVLEVNKADKDEIAKKYETDWFNATTSSTYSFDFSNSEVASIENENLSARVLFKVTTAYGGFLVNDIVFAQSEEIVGATGSNIGGVLLYIRDKVVSMRTGNTAPFFLSPNASAQASYSNIKVKIIVEGYL